MPIVRWDARLSRAPFWRQRAGSAYERCPHNGHFVAPKKVGKKTAKKCECYSTLRSAALKKPLQNVVLLKLHIKGRESVRQKYEKIWNPYNTAKSNSSLAAVVRSAGQSSLYTRHTTPKRVLHDKSLKKCFCKGPITTPHKQSEKKCVFAPKPKLWKRAITTPHSTFFSEARVSWKNTKKCVL